MPDTNKSVKFESKYKKLEEILDWFDSEDFNLDQAETKFNEGIKLVDALEKRLKEAEQKVQKLEKRLDN